MVMVNVNKRTLLSKSRLSLGVVGHAYNHITLANPQNSSSLKPAWSSTQVPDSQDYIEKLIELILGWQEGSAETCT